MTNIIDNAKSSGPYTVANQRPINDKGQQHGQWVLYTKNGLLDTIGEYINGQQHGLWTWYFESGSVKAHITFDMGKRIKEILYNENGTTYRETLMVFTTPPELNELETRISTLYYRLATSIGDKLTKADVEELRTISADLYQILKPKP